MLGGVGFVLRVSSNQLGVVVVVGGVVGVNRNPRRRAAKYSCSSCSLHKSIWMKWQMVAETQPSLCS